MKRIRAAAVLAGALGLAAPSGALVIGGSSNAFGVGGDATIDPLSILPPTVVSVPDLPAASGSAPAPYDVSDGVGSVGDGTVIDANTLSVTASSTVDGLLGGRLADATSTVEDLGILLSTLLSLDASSIFSSAQVSGDSGSFVATGHAVLEGTISVPGAPTLPGVLDEQPEANTIVGGGLLDPLGITVILNEQILDCGTPTYCSITVNAIHILVDGGVPGLNTIDADIVIGHSFAELVAAPEPSTGVLLGLALAGMAARRPRRL